MEIELSATEHRRAGVCPHCGRAGELAVVVPRSAAPIAVRRELLLRCPGCERLALPAGVARRLVALILLAAFSLVLAAGLATAGYLVVRMVTEDRLHGGFVVVAALLAGGCGFGLSRTLPRIRHLLRPGALLPLGHDPRRQLHVFEGEL